MLYLLSALASVMVSSIGSSSTVMVGHGHGPMDGFSPKSGGTERVHRLSVGKLNCSTYSTVRFSTY